MRAPPEIRQLSDEVANQIAAGEVVERPAAVVKELAENAIDAGATRIVVRCEDGGRRLVEVSDDGHGMRPDDLRRALSRHATSKLRDAGDLFRVATLGFRGEALPSIAAVSEFEMASRPHDAQQGQRLALAGGAEQAFAPVAMAPGTRVAVANLFWNVPVRLKFLKSEAAETGHVTEQVVRLALGHPRIAFRLESGGRAIIDLPADESLAGRCRALFGKDLADGLLPVAASAGPMQVAGFVAHPREAKATAKRQYLFLNGRHVRDRLLVAAVREGFKGFLEPRLHGAVFLALDLDASLVDVNVHPTKAEVRFRREGEVFALVSRAINQVLAQHSGGFSLLAGAAATPAPAASGVADAPFARTIVKAPLPAAAPMWQERFLPATPMTEPARPTAPPLSLPADPPRRVGEHASAYQPPTPAPVTARQPAADPHLPGVRRVLQLDDMYLLIETDTGIRLIDQHALHEKALWLQLDAAATDLARGGVQELLIPKTVELSAAEVATVEPLLPPLADHGIRAEVFGPTTLLLRAHPAALRRMNWSGFFTSLASSGSGAKALADVRERIGHSIACHGAVKAGQRLSTEEQLDLVRLLYRLEHMEHCPHGRPTTLDLSWKELERRFQRS
ncbi:MAG TPA: DNA mismatch repair endonuclease MutL [Planctomycetota bacterium]|nr:DNA mismatch repair endonuclease MutL [Planctomycetota bacterium]